MLPLDITNSDLFPLIPYPPHIPYDYIFTNMLCLFYHIHINNFFLYILDHYLLYEIKYLNIIINFRKSVSVENVIYTILVVYVFTTLIIAG